MSAVEVAGLILGIIPVIQLGIDSYKRNFSDTKKIMLQLGRSFETQKLIYLNTIEEILSSVVPDSQLNKLLRNVDEKAWQDSRLSQVLQSHLGDIHPQFKDIVLDIKDMMMELEKLLAPPTDSLNAKAKLKNIKRYLSRSKGEAGLGRLNRRLGDLETLKNQSQTLAVLRHEREARADVLKKRAALLTSDMNPANEKFQAIRAYHKVGECARSLHSALARGWHCECETPHFANLRLEARRPSSNEMTSAKVSTDKTADDSDQRDLRFKFLFSYATGGDDEAGTDNSKEPLAWREAEIAPFVHDPDAKLKINPRNQGTTSRSSDNGACVPDSRDEATSGKLDPPKIRATRFVFPERKPLPQINKQAKREDIKNIGDLEIKDLCQLIRNIQNADTDEDTCHGVLADEEDACYGLYSINTREDVKSPLASIHIGSQRPFAQTKSGKDFRVKLPKLSQAMKYEAALTLGSTVLQLHSTPWLENWVKQDVLYVPSCGDGDDSGLLQPYISKHFSSSKLPDGASIGAEVNNASNMWIANGTLLVLSILLIELAYSKPIETLAETKEKTPIPIVTAQIVAKRLSKQISAAMGKRYQLAVAWCLSNDLGYTRSEPDLHSEEFQLDFLEHVIVPLQQSIDFFHSPSIS